MREKKGISWRMVLSGVIALSILIGWCTFHANFLIGRSLLFAFPGWETTYHAAFPWPLGGAVASDVTLISPLGPQAGTFHFDHVSLDVPFFEYWRSALSRGRNSMVDEIHELHFEFSGGRGDLAVPLTRELAVFGNVTAAPLEAAGCTVDDYWVFSELGGMGLSTSPVTLVLDYVSEEGRFIKHQKLIAPGRGSVEYRRDISQPGQYAMLTFEGNGATALVADEWHIKDDGFVAARNRHCAPMDGIDVDPFVDRHVRSVERLLAIVGVAPTPAMESAYRTFARDGGSFDVVVHYDPPLSGPVYDADALSAWLPYMRAEAGVNGNMQPLGLVATEPQPWPDWAAELTVFQLLQRENVARGGDGQVAVSSPAGSGTSNPVARATDAARVAAAATVPAATSEAARVAGSAGEPDAVTVTPETLPEDPSRMVTLMASTAAAPAAVPTQGTAPEDLVITNYRELAEHVGEYLVVHQRGKRPARLKITGVREDGEVRVRARYRSGYFEYGLERDEFLRAEK